MAAPHLMLCCDYGPGVGAGHVVRQLALGHAFVAAGGTAVLRIDAPPSRWIAELAASYRVDVVIEAEAGSTGDVVVFDSYRVRPETVDASASRSLVVLVDDFAQLDHHGAAVLLDHNHGAEPADYPDAPTASRLLLGSNYTLIRPEFTPDTGVRAPGPLRILLALGGEPDPELLGSLADRIVSEFDEVELLRVDGGVADMAAFMRHADLAVSASGSTVYELARLGIPSVVFPIVENQRRISKSLAASGIVVESTAAHAATAAAELASDPRLQSNLSAAARRCIDGRGPARVVAALLALL